MQRILVVGGAGFIGSHMVKMLLAHGYEVISLDNLSTGFRAAVLGGVFIHADLADRAELDKLFAQYRFTGVMHFASSIQVGESVCDPAKYYRNNLVNTLNLLDTMVSHDTRHLVFSSSAAVFGEPQAVPICENHPLHPLNPYGQSKLMVERILADYDHAYGLKSVALRYFNAAGADPEGLLGECHTPETHLIPLALRAAAGRMDKLTVHGSDYATPDGTCIRDYVHVTDLCHAHLSALEYLLSGGHSNAFNLGNGLGFSVQEVVKTIEEVTGLSIPITFGARRDGDPARLVADAAKARIALDWAPQYPDLQTIVRHAWQWEKQRQMA